MSKIDFAAINAALNPESKVRDWLPDGRKNGSEWVARNPTRSDNTPGSFSVNLKTGRWADFATGDSGGDLVSLYAYLYCGGDNGKAAKELAEAANMNIGPAERAAAASNISNIADSQPKVIFPVPASAPEPRFRHGKFGEPTAVYPYKDKDGRVLMYVVRFDPPDMRKQVLPYSWCEHPDGTARWTWRGITGKNKRPLYGLDRLAAMPEADVLIVEGEKTADAAQRLVGPDFAVVAWLGGTETADRVHLRALAGRRVILWPDADMQRERMTREDEAAGVDPASKPLLQMHEQPGMRAMLTIAQALRGNARETLLVGYTMGQQPGGWDLADAVDEGWTADDVLEAIRTRAADPFHVARDPAPAPGNDNRLPLDAAVNPFGFPHLSDKGQPMNTVENLAFLLDEYGIRARYNVIRKAVEVDIPGREYGADNRANCSLAELGSICARNRLPQSSLSDYVKLIADRNAFNPVIDWIRSKPWDGRSRLNDLFDTVQADMDPQLKNTLIFRWLISAVAAVAKPRGFTSHGVLVFTGSQGQGKTSWVKALVPAEMGVVLDGAIVEPSNKDTIINAVSHWLVELGELDATFRKADIARLKSFITQPVDKLRRPYDRVESEYQRRTVFFASVNENRYLVDDTGNRRWWTVPVTALNYEHNIDTQQLWAEVLTHFEGGERWWLDAAELELLNGINTEHEAVDPVQERILSMFDWEFPGAGEKMTATEVLIAIGFDRPNRAAATHASAVLQKITGGKPERTGSGRYFRMPPRMTNARPADDDRPF